MRCYVFPFKENLPATMIIPILSVLILIPFTSSSEDSIILQSFSKSVLNGRASQEKILKLFNVIYEVSKRLSHLENQMVLLYSKNENQANDLDTIKKHISQLNSEQTKKIKQNFSEDVKSSRKVSKRSVQVGDNSDSFWSKVQLSSLELGVMPYDNYGISIYAHPNNNAQRDNPQKQFYYSPMSQLLHKSAEASFNNVTKQHEVTFGIQMWTEEFEDQVRKYAEKLVKHPIEQEKIRVLSVEMVKLSSEHQSPSYQLKDQWIHYKRNQVLSFKLVCQKFDTCHRLADEMRSRPQQFNHLFRLDFTTSTHTLKSQEIAIKMGTIADGSLLSKLIQRYPEERDIFITAEDELRLLNETKTNIIASLGDLFQLDPTSEEKIDDLLKNLLIESRGKITSNHSPDIWESVFWSEENYRPDKIAKLMNEIFRKLNSKFQEELSNCFKEDSKITSDVNAQLLDVLFKQNSISKEQLDKLFKESKGNIIWVGKEFIPKPVLVSKLNRVKLSDMKSLPDKKTIISYSKVMFSTGVNIQANYKEEDFNQIIQLKSKLEDLQAKINTSIPKEMQDFKSAFYLLRDKVNKLDTSVTSNLNQLKDLKPISDSMVNHVRQLDEQGKETSIELSKLRSGVSGWNEGKNGSFLWKDNCDFWDASGNVRDIITVNSAKEDCGIKCQEHSECTHFTWNGGCILKKASVSQEFRYFDSMLTQVRQLGEEGKDFKSAFNLLRSKVNELDISVTSNVKDLNELKPISDSMVYHVRQLIGDQGKDWKEGKNGGFVWQDHCDFVAGNVRDITIVNSAKEDCGIKCLEQNGCTHFTWNGKCILKKAPASENFVHLNNAICGKLKVSEASRELAKFKAKLSDYHSTSTFIFRIINFRSKRENTAKEPFIFSDPFYTSKHGYKLRVKLYPNGDDDGKGTHLSIYMEIQPGEYDALLPWSFSHKVKFILLDQSTNITEKSNVEHQIDNSKYPECFQRPLSNKANAGIGTNKFASHELLVEGGKFVKDDTFFIKITTSN